ncbi:MAG: response regulator transcription factor [Bacteroidota bacterium]
MNLASHFHILIVEDNLVVGVDIRATLQELGFQRISLARTIEQAKHILEANLPDLVLLDIHLEDHETGIDLAHLINRDYRIPFVYLTAYADDLTLKEAKETVPAGYVMKPFHLQQLKAAIEIAQHNYYAVIRPNWTQVEDINDQLIEPLTLREMELLELICQGITNRELAEHLSLSINTIKTHLKNLYLKLGVNNRAEVILKVQHLVY